MTEQQNPPASVDETATRARDSISADLEQAAITSASIDDSGGSEPPADEDSSVSGDPVPAPTRRRHNRSRGRVLAFGILPALMLVLASAAGYLAYVTGSARDSRAAAISSVQAATDGTIALLSYTPDTAEAKLSAARDLLTGSFRDDYTSLTNDVVIPGAIQKAISATARVPAASSTSASANHAVVLVFVNQTVVIGNDAPSETASAVEVTLDKAGDRWLISGFDPK